MKLIPNLSFDGKCAEALEYYKDIFDGEIIQAITYSEFDFGCDPLLKDKIFSGILIFGSNTLYMNDEKNEFNNCNWVFYKLKIIIKSKRLHSLLLFIMLYLIIKILKLQ